MLVRNSEKRGSHCLCYNGTAHCPQITRADGIHIDLGGFSLRSLLLSGGVCYCNVFSRTLSHSEIGISVDICDALPMSIRPNVAVECVLGVLLHIQDITRSKHDPQESCPVLRGFCQ